MVFIASPIWLGVLDLIVEDVGMVGAICADARQLRDIAGRSGVGQQRDARPPAPRAPRRGRRAVASTPVAAASFSDMNSRTGSL